MITGTARSKLVMQWTGTEEAFLKYTEWHANETDGELDSRDLGDALGYWERYMRDPDNDPPFIREIDDPDNDLALENIRLLFPQLFNENGFTFDTILEGDEGILFLRLDIDIFEWEGVTE